MSDEQVIAVEIDPAYLTCAVVGADGGVSHRRQVAACSSDFDSLIVELVNLIQETAFECDAVSRVAVAAHGVYSATLGTVRWGDGEHPLLDTLRAHMSLPLDIESRRLTAILGEQWVGAAQGVLDAVYLRGGPPWEAGILCGGRLVRGVRDAAGSGVTSLDSLIEVLDPEVVILHPGCSFPGGIPSPLAGDAALIGAARGTG